jgi:hypothetical protein
MHMLLLTSLLLSNANAQDAAAAEAPPPFEVHGVYAIWALNQHNFLLGKDHPLNDADYVVQMLRVAPTFTKEHYGVVARMDLAQGWWGTDNDPNVGTTSSIDEDGVVTTDTVYNPYAMFRNKDTNYGVHVDHAYAWVDVPRVPVKVQAGRMWYGAGHKLVLDQDADGVQIVVDPEAPIAVSAYWAKMSEGLNSTKNPKGLLMNDEDEWNDADLFGGSFTYASAPAKVELFGMYYWDRSGTGSEAYLPNGYGYLNSRYRPHITTATAIGLTIDGKLEVADGLNYAVEGDYLFGTDDVNNGDHGGGNVDINNGQLSGWNAYVKADQHFTAGIPMSVGVTFGMGSGDDDVTGGKGNINKIQTMGFFPLTNVWEDSVMPDVGGISPQGLGSPVSRGYRELENTTAVQGKLGLTPHEKVTFDASYTYLRATQAIHGFDELGVPTGQSSQDLGMEIDANLGINVYKGFGYKCLFGVFMPGDAAGYLINGTNANLDPAWEVKQVVTAKF